jgi:hypothetical protein
MEWTDDTFGRNERRDDEGGGAADVTSIAWVTAIVLDASETASFLSDLAGAKPVEGNVRGPADREDTVDMRVGDVTVRLITPESPSSPYSSFLRGGRPRLHSVAFRVPDLDAAVAALESAGVPAIRREDGLVATDPAATFGVAMEWTA